MVELTSDVFLTASMFSILKSVCNGTGMHYTAHKWLVKQFHYLANWYQTCFTVVLCQNTLDSGGVPMWLF